MHGAGNDFVVVDGRGMDRDWASLAVAVSDRHFGVGSDGLLLVLPSDVADARMRMWNPDGSEAEMCGNGIRCFAKFAVERGLVTPRDGRFLAETHIGVLEVEPIMRDGKVVRARVNQGKPVLTPELVPVDPSQRLVPIGAGHATAQSGNGSERAVLQPDGHRIRLAAGGSRPLLRLHGRLDGQPPRRRLPGHAGGGASAGGYRSAGGAPRTLSQARQLRGGERRRPDAPHGAGVGSAARG